MEATNNKCSFQGPCPYPRAKSKCFGNKGCRSVESTRSCYMSRSTKGIQPKSPRTHVENNHGFHIDPIASRRLKELSVRKEIHQKHTARNPRKGFQEL